MDREYPILVKAGAFSSWSFLVFGDLLYHAWLGSVNLQLANRIANIIKW